MRPQRALPLLWLARKEIVQNDWVKENLAEKDPNILKLGGDFLKFMSILISERSANA